MPHNTSISEFERQKQERIDIIKNLIRMNFTDLCCVNDDKYVIPDERVLSKLVRSILIEIDKV